MRCRNRRLRSTTEKADSENGVLQSTLTYSLAFCSTNDHTFIDLRLLFVLSLTVSQSSLSISFHVVMKDSRYLGAATMSRTTWSAAHSEGVDEGD